MASRTQGPPSCGQGAPIPLSHHGSLPPSPRLWVQVPTPLLPSCLTWGKLLKLSNPLSSDLSKGGVKTVPPALGCGEDDKGARLGRVLHGDRRRADAPHASDYCQCCPRPCMPLLPDRGRRRMQAPHGGCRSLRSWLWFTVWPWLTGEILTPSRPGPPCRAANFL